MLTCEYRNLINDILSLLSISSVTGDLDGISNCQNFLKKLAYSMGFKVSMHGNDKVLIISPVKSFSQPKLGLVVHIDTVPLLTPYWHHLPLGEIFSDRIYGRGIIDDKGPTITALHALNVIKNDIHGSWQLIIGSSEEGEWSDMRDFLAEKPLLPDFLVTLDGDGIQNGCRGYMDVSLKFKKETSTSFITDFFVPNGSNNTLPAKAVSVINGHTVFSHGKASHSSIPKNGHSAITTLAVHVKEVFPSTVYLEYRKMFDLLYMLDENPSISMFGLTDFSEIGTSISVTNASMKDGEITINLNIRFSPSLHAGDICLAMTKLSKLYGCTVSFDYTVNPSFIAENQPEFAAMKHAYEQVLGRKPAVTFAKGLGYNAALPNCAIFGPRFDSYDEQDPDFCHQPDESRKIDDIIKFYEMLKAFLLETL